jgi:hypothetical protein
MTIKNAFMSALSYRRHYTADHPLRLARQLRQLGDVGRNPPYTSAELSTELIDEVASGCQIRKAPAIKDLLLSYNPTSVMRLNTSRLMKIYDPTA